MLTDEQKLIAKTAIQDYCGGDYREDYSGRGMYGATYPAVVYDSLSDAINDMIDMVVAFSEYDPCDETIVVLHSMRTVFKAHKIDSMDTGVVVCFPILKTAKGVSDGNS
jgi:hypothetical protein